MRSRLGRLAAVFGMVVTAALVVPTAGVRAVGLVSGSAATQQSTHLAIAPAKVLKKKKKKPCPTSPNSPTTIPPKC